MPDTERRPGHATREGTQASAVGGPMEPTFYREARGLVLSTLGMGSYLGETGASARKRYQEAAREALEGGIDVLDTASNYRHQASERDLGAALADVEREGVFVVTKGGFLHGDVDHPGGMQAFVQETYVQPGILEPTDVVGGSHAMTPAFLRTELSRSLDNLGLETIDLYLVHNPETQLGAGVTREAFEERIGAAFQELERQRGAGAIRGYGVATWDGLRVGPGHPKHLSLERLLEIATDARRAVAGNDQHGFTGIQLPVNLAMPEALTEASQPWEGRHVPALEAARRAGLIVLASASLMQARLLGSLPPEVRQVFDASTDLEAALAFARSAPGVTAALVGMGSPEHVEENLAAVRGRGPDPDAVEAALEALSAGA